MSRGFLTLLGLVAGAGTGLALEAVSADAAALAVAICRPIGRLWLSALQMTVLPLVVSVLVVGVAEVADVAHMGRIARRTLAWIAGLSLAAALVTVPLARAAFRVFPRSPDLTGILAQAAPPAETPANGWLTILPDNVVAAAADGAIAPVVVFTLLFGLALAQLDAARRAPVIELARSVESAMTILIGWILTAAAVGVFALALPLTATGGGRAIGELGGYVAVLIGVYALVTAATYVVVWTAGVGLGRFAAGALPAQSVAAGTQSSLASLPAMLRAAGELGCPPAVGGLVLPLAVSLFRITSPVQYLVIAEFIAWTQGVELGWGSLVMLVPLAVVISLGSVGLPGQASFMGTTLPVVQAAGLPIEPLGLLLAVDVIPDVAATVGNVTADLALATRVAAAEHRLDIPRS